jgi:hypothetical protein
MEPKSSKPVGDDGVAFLLVGCLPGGPPATVFGGVPA